MKTKRLALLFLIAAGLFSVGALCQHKPCNILTVMAHLESFSSCPSVLTDDDLLAGLGAGCVSVEQDWTEEQTPALYYLVHHYVLPKEKLWCWAVVEGGTERKIVTLGVSSVALSEKKCCNHCQESLLPAPATATLFGVMLGDSSSKLKERMGDPQTQQRARLGQTGPWDMLQYERESCSYKFYLEKGRVVAFSVERS